jgi:hypothetical protein
MAGRFNAGEASGAVTRGRKAVFFFEKRYQKTFASGG